MLEILGLPAVYQRVWLNRVMLGFKYCHGFRYLPPGTLIARVQDMRLRRRAHDKALSLASSTSLLVQNSSLEDIIVSWNSLNCEFVSLSLYQLKKLMKCNPGVIEVGPDLQQMRDSLRVM